MRTYEYLQGDEPIQRVVNDMRAGQLDCWGSLTMEAGSSSTEIADPRINAQSRVTLIPLSANAAAVKWWVSGRSPGKVAIGHDSVAGDRGFDWIALG